MRAATFPLLAVIVAAVLLVGCTTQAPVMTTSGVSAPYPPLNGRMYHNVTVNQSLPTAGQNILATNITLPSNYQPPVAFIEILFASNASGILSVSRNLSTYDGNFAVSDEHLNLGVALFPNQTYVFVVPMFSSEQLNLHYSSTGTIQRLAIMDLYDGGYSQIQVLNGTVVI